MGIFDYVKNMFATKGIETGISAFKDGQAQYPTDNFLDNAIGGYGKNEVVFACIQEISSSLAEAPIESRDADGMPVLTDTTVDLIRRPNPFMSEYEFWETTVNHLYLAGNAYWMKIKTGRGKVKEIWPLRPDRMRIVPDQDKYIKNYLYNLDGKNYPIKAEDIVHFKFPNPADDLMGMSPLRPALRQIATDNDATDFSKVMLQNGGVPSGILKIPEPLSREARQRIKSQWKQSYGGSKRGEIAVLEGDTSFEQISMDMQSLAFADLRGISESRICMVFGVPPIIIGAKVGLDKASYANYKEARESFWEETISALHRRLASKLESDKDLNPFSRRFSFDTSNVSAYSDKRQQSFNNAVLGVQAGILTVDEARAEIGKDPREDEPELEPDPEPKMEMPEEREEETKTLELQLEKKQRELDLLQQSLGMLSSADKYYDRFEHWAKKEYKRQGKQFATLLDQNAEVVSTKSLDDDTPLPDINLDKVMAELGALEIIWTEHAKESVEPIMEGLMKEAGLSTASALDTDIVISNEEILTFIGEHNYKFANSVAKSSVEIIKKSVQKAFEESKSLKELRDDLKDKFAGKISKNRATTIARTETIRAANEGARATYKAAGVTKMTWIASTDACPYCRGLNGKTISVEENFLSKDDVYMPEGTKKALNLSYGDIPSPPVHPGCRCTIVPSD
jgi:HK97 family phage portal protein